MLISGICLAYAVCEKYQTGRENVPSQGNEKNLKCVKSDRILFVVFVEQFRKNFAYLCIMLAAYNFQKYLFNLNKVRYFWNI